MLGGSSVLSITGYGAALIAFSVAVYVWRHRSERVATPLAALMLTLALWSLVYSIQLGYGSLADQLAWQRVTLGIAGFVPPVWLVFVLTYTDNTDWLSRERVLVLLLEPVAFLALNLTNHRHNLVWTDATMQSTLVGGVPALDFGMGYVIHIAFAYALVGAGIAILLAYGSKIAPTYQQQVLLIVLAAAPPFLSHILFTLGASPMPALDLTPFLFAFSGVIFGLALFQFDLLRLAPIARTQSFEEIGDGLVVINTDGKIVDLFGVAPSVIEPTPAVGDRISSIFPDTRLTDLDGIELHPSDQRGHVYQVQVSSLTDHQGREVGTILTLRDITAFWASNQRLSVSNRVLRHNLRNDMTVVLGVAEQLASRLSGRNAEDAERIRRTADHLVEIAEKARQITELPLTTDGTNTTIDAVAHLRELIEEVQTTYPDAEIQATMPESQLIEVPDSEPFRIAHENILDNAIKHNDSTVPRVEVTVESDEETTRIHVTDNGPGIPEIEQEAIGAEAETPLNHSRGIGLWLTHWCVRMWDGELQLDSSSNGTTVTISVSRPGAESDQSATSTH